MKAPALSRDELAYLTNDKRCEDCNHLDVFHESNDWDEHVCRVKSCACGNWPDLGDAA